METQVEHRSANERVHKTSSLKQTYFLSFNGQASTSITSLLLSANTLNVALKAISLPSSPDMMELTLSLSPQISSSWQLL